MPLAPGARIGPYEVAALISTGGGRDPVWSPDGSELFYLDLSGDRMMVVSVSTEPTLTLGGRPRSRSRDPTFNSSSADTMTWRRTVGF